MTAGTAGKQFVHSIKQQIGMKRLWNKVRDAQSKGLIGDLLRNDAGEKDDPLWGSAPVLQFLQYA